LSTHGYNKSITIKENLETETFIIEALSVLLCYYPDVNILSNNWSVLHTAVSKGMVNVVKYLLSIYNIDVTVGENILEVARKLTKGYYEGRSEIIKILKKAISESDARFLKKKGMVAKYKCKSLVYGDYETLSEKIGDGAEYTIGFILYHILRIRPCPY
jgi:hypothetical protein